MNSYTIVHEDSATYRLIQDVPGEGNREAAVEHGEALCAVCDAMIAREGETVNIGHRCRRCRTEVIGFEPVHL